MRARLAKIPGLRRTFRRGRALSRRVLRRNYPTILAVTEPNMPVVNFVRKHGCRQIAEIGCYRGHTTLELARVLDGDGSIHVFDFAEFVELVVTKLSNSGYENVVGFPSSRRTYDSYNWPLMRLLQEHSEPIYDFVLLDGAHTWPHDALAFLLVDRLIKPGGFIHFDDYDWCLALSPSLNPEVFPASKRNWTAEQLEEQHVRLIIETLVRPDPRWREIVPNQTFQKASLRD